MGARAAGMADAYTVTADDVLSLYYNPAGLVHVRRPELGATYNRLFMGLDDKSELSRSFLGYAHPLSGKRGTLGVSFIQLSLPGLYSENTIGLSYARPLHEKWNVGGSLKMLRKNFGSDLYTSRAINVDSGASLGGRDPLFDGGSSKSGMGLDLGAQYKVGRNYAMGLSLRNINQPDLALGSEGDKVPAVIGLGLGRWTRVSALSIDVSRRDFAGSQDLRVSLGGERWFRSGLGMRAGLGLGSREYRSLAVGGSYRMDGFQLDYALNYPLQGIEKTAGTHMVSLTYRFGKPAPDPIEARLESEREARLHAEAEMLKLRAQLMELTAGQPGAPSENDTMVVDQAAQEAQLQAEAEVKRLQAQKPEPVKVAAALPAVAAPAAVPAPAKPAANAALLAQYSDALKFYSQQVKSGAPVEERRATLRRILEKYQSTGFDTAAIKTELKKLEGEDTKTNQEYQLSVSYYKRIVQQGTNTDERVILLDRIVKKYKPLGVNTGELERELESLKKSR